jgi:hypothetical protein
MGFNITQIINKFLPTKRVDDDLRENPFQTKFGQEIVSVQESFEARLWREGRPISQFANGNALPTGSDTTISMYASAGCELYPVHISITADVDCIVTIQHTTNLQDFGNGGNSIWYEPMYLKAGTPFIRQYRGELKYLEQGYCMLMMRGATTAGKVYASMYGIEVSSNA